MTPFPDGEVTAFAPLNWSYSHLCTWLNGRSATEITIKKHLFIYRISANSFRGNYSFLNLALFTVTFDLYFINLNSCRGNYSREETIQGRKLFAEIRYSFLEVGVRQVFKGGNYSRDSYQTFCQYSKAWLANWQTQLTNCHVCTQVAILKVQL